MVIMNIKDFFNVFIDTYKTVNKDKIEAKNILKEKKLKYKKLQENLKDIKIAQSYLYKIYLLLDENERKTSVQDTLDLLQYGPKSKLGNRFWGQNNYYQIKYESLIVEIKAQINNIKKYIKEHKYSEVIRMYKEDAS